MVFNKLTFYRTIANGGSNVAADPKQALEKTGDITLKDIDKDVKTVKEFNFEICKLIIDGKLNAEVVSSEGYTKGDSVLHYAVRVLLPLSEIDLLIKRGAKLDARNKDGKTVLEFAEENQYYDTLSEELDHEKMVHYFKEKLIGKSLLFISRYNITTMQSQSAAVQPQPLENAQFFSEKRKNLI